MVRNVEVAIIGGGPAGLAAALAAHKAGAKDVLILERDSFPGGILQQCIHNGFGLHYFGQELTGPEYAQRFIDEVEKIDSIEILLDTMALEVTPERRITAVSGKYGLVQVQAGAVVLAMGCRERTRGALNIPGTRPAGVYTAGCAQRLVNMEGYMPGRRAVILGSGDIGLIMARRLTWEGAKVEAVVELMPYSSGLNRNIVQCLQDYNIPLYLSHTVTDIKGHDRIEQIVVSRVDENRRPIPGTEMVFDCDTLLLSVGLLPENELTRAAGITLDPRTRGAVVYENMETSMPGVFACGNVVHVHDLVDYVTAESQKAGAAAAHFVQNGQESESGRVLELKNGDRVNYTVPQKLRLSRMDKSVGIFFRVSNIFRNVEIQVTDGETVLCRFPREHVAPGEMENITLPRVLAEKAKGSTLTVQIVDKG